MRKYTASYTYTNPNFVIQNLDYTRSTSDMLPLIYVLKNLLQRGFPTTMSKFLQSKIGKIHEADDYEQRLLLISAEPSHWFDTIKGGDNNYNPAQYFFEHIIPNELGEYSYVQPMIIPEIEINEIIGTYNPDFQDQKVDFYLPQALLVIEIDGPQHASNRGYDARRNEYLRTNGIETVRITTGELQRHEYYQHLESIKNCLRQYEGNFAYYKDAIEKSKNNAYTDNELKNKMLPTAVIRFQILLLEFLAFERLHFGEHWNFNILCTEPYKNFAELAIEDIYIWLNHLVKLRDKHELPKFDYEINIAPSANKFIFDPDAINIDFSLIKRYTDESRLKQDVIFVRSDYFDFSVKRNQIGLDKNYFEVCTAPSINYHITDDDKPILRFFLQNLFNKDDFRDGQFSIIANALNLHDTIGLLPTGGGKSLCYQLPCLLQPSINFVVCPIKSLMYDQIDNLKRGDVTITNLNLICSDKDADEREQIVYNYARGKYLFIWISPERFQIKSFRDTIKKILTHYNISYAVIDEVHCISEWGHDFRTSYLNLTKTIDALSPKDENGEGIIKYIGLTATASVNVLKDIRVEFSRRKQQLEDDNIKTLIDYTRPELDFIVIDDERNKEKNLLRLLEENDIPNDHSKATLIFTPFVNGKNGCFQLANNLSSKFPQQVAWYAGSIPTENIDRYTKKPIMSEEDFDKYKIQTQEAFKGDKLQILCATKAFGMGIDKQNIFYTFHYGLPSSVEALYQEAGRAGRWDKRDQKNKDKRGKCYVLHSHESEKTKDLAERLFIPNQSIERMKEILKEAGFDGEDIFRQMFLYLGKLPSVEKEYEHIIKIINKFFKPNEEVCISYDEIRHPDYSITPDAFEKYIYRLCLLGIVDDWTNDFNGKFQVYFNSIKPEHIIQSLKTYIGKYAPEEKVEDNILNVDHYGCDTILQKSVWYLLDWIFRHITETRKQSLKTLSDWCLDYHDSASFKKRLDSYFTFNESTYVLQHIAEHAFDYKQWFAIFYWVDKHGNRTDRFITQNEIMKLRDRLSRFLESYHNSPGIDFVSGIIRALLNDFEDADGRPRLEQAMKAIADRPANANTVFFDTIIPFLRDAHFSTEAMAEVGAVIAQYLPSLADTLADTFEMPWIFNDIIKKNVDTIRKINIALYEQIGRIQ